MKISRENYEIWFIDYLDGKLSDDAVQVLHAFLEVNSDLAEEFDLITNQSLKFDSPEEIVFPDKSILKKAQDEFSEELNLLLAKEAESNLTSSEKDFLESQLILHPHLRKHQQAMKRARLISSKTILEDKSPIRFSEWPTGLEDELLIISILEGDASPEDVKKFEKRLAAEPTFNQVYERFLSIKLSSNHVAFPHKGELIFPEAPNLSNKEILLAAHAEGDLTGAEKSAATALISSEPESARLFEKLQSLRIASPSHITFPHKASLYQKAAVVIPLKRYFAYASGVAAAIAVIMWFSNQKTGTEQGFAETSKPQTVEVHAPLDSSTDTTVNSMASQQGQSASGDSDVANRPEALKNDSSGSNRVITPISPFEAVKSGEIAQNRLELPQRLQSKDGLLPVYQNLTELAIEAPDMELVYTPTAAPIYTPSSGDANLFSLLGRAAANKLENTYAYSLATRQMNRITEVKEESLEMNTAASEDRFRIKIGQFSFDRQVSANQPKQKRHGIIGMIERVYDKVSNP
ncbi:MAG: hypothetical protein IPP69_07155 [Flavobacteriales bacterium]|nr:hypothetical protein [Flavobacteriales bacterium]